MKRDRSIRPCQVPPCRQFHTSTLGVLLLNIKYEILIQWREIRLECETFGAECQIR